MAKKIPTNFGGKTLSLCMNYESKTNDETNILNIRMIYIL